MNFFRSPEKTIALNVGLLALFCAVTTSDRTNYHLKVIRMNRFERLENFYRAVRAQNPRK